MSDAIVKGAKRPSSRPTSQSATTKSSAKGRKTTSAGSARLKPIVKRPTTEKAPVRKATRSKATGAASTQKAARGAKPAKRATGKTAAAKSAKSRAAAPDKGRAKATPARTAAKPAKKSVPAKARPTKTPVPARRTPPARTPATAQPKRAPAPAPRQPTRDEAAALRAFERAHKEFARGNFAEARALFRHLIDQHPGVSEVAARARTYLAIAEARLRSESALPRDAEALYDRGVIELNRGEYVAAQEMFERALKRDPESADAHYALAATRARLGSVETALQSLERALNLKYGLRVRAQHDPDLVSLRNEPEFERLVFAPRS